MNRKHGKGKQHINNTEYFSQILFHQTNTRKQEHFTKTEISQFTDSNLNINLKQTKQN